ncbi:lamin tail domain-containing protein [Ascidiimonas sp. W6]|uniref:lamin tail domain-containing protein n=1 Tax=Ascidiimonas meishanensis TaxID=3128903 RepID=UPI0030ECAF73
MKVKLLFLSVLGLLLFSVLPITAQSVFINEIHYDNTGTDVDEAIEVAGPAGTDLTGYTLVLYNGSNGSVYNTITLSGVLADEQGGYGTSAVVLPSNGIQNGSPDGIALADASNNLIQFLSYEGTLTGVGGVADGVLSTDIGVAETGNPIGTSLQLAGEGTVYEDFTWKPPVASSYNAVNVNQVFGTPEPVINEFVFNHTGSDTDEFVEIKGTPNTDLSSYTLIEIEGDSNAPGIIDEVIALGTTDSNGYWTTGFGSNTFENGTVTLLLVKNFTGALGDDLDTDDDGTPDVTPWEAIIDGIGVNDGGTGDFNYSTLTLVQSFDGSSFTVGGASRIPDGTNTGNTSDWTRNDFDGQGLPSFPTAVAENGEALNTPGAENALANVVAPIVLVINEVDADTAGTDTLEFVELFDGGVGNASLDGYVLVFYNGSNNLSYATYDLNGFTTNANGYLVLGNADVANVSIVFGSNGLQNGADAVALYKANASDFPNGTAVTLTGLEDAVVYDTNDGDDADLLILLNAGEPQVNEDAISGKDIQSIQRFPNGSGGLRNTSTYVNAIPTPGRANTNATEEVNLIINELDADTAGSDVEEFVELYDGGSGNTSLSGYILVLYNGNGDTSYNTIDLSGFTTNAEGYFVVGNAGVANVGLVVPGNTFQNGADAVALYQADAASFPNGTAVTTENLIDAIVYDTNDADDIALLTLLNAGEAQVNEGGGGDKDGQSSQRIPNGEGGPRNTTTYTQATPTPGTENGGTVTPGDPVTIAEARNAVLGTTVTISGVLTVSDQFAGSAYIQDSTGGIAIFDATVHGEGIFAIGDSITLTGVRSAFNDQIQISPVNAVVANGLPNEPIQPRTITLAELANYPGELVRVINPVFPDPAELLFGNSNVIVSDASGNGEIRIDNDVAALVGLAQPESCAEAIGVVGRFRESYQLLPRQFSDLSCAVPYENPANNSPVSKDDSFDVVSWNIEWFGDENNSPAAGNPLSDPIQRDSVRSVILALDADVITVQEIADDALFAELVAGLPGYDFILSDAFSNPQGTPPFQKLGFIYKTSTVTPKETRALLKTIHPLYNGGDDTALVNYPSTTDRFYASGRLPFLMTADVTINNVTEEISLISLHARANSGNASQNRYDMRKYDVEVLKDSLDVQFADKKFILLGDYNDDVDETVADISSTISSFEAYVNDTERYQIVTDTLSEQGFRSFVFRENMIDHIAVSNELFDAYLDGSATVHYEFYDNDYTNTASDHFPVSARLILIEPLELTVSATEILCADETATATVTVNGGAAPYTYLWSDGQTTAEAIELGAGEYTVTVTDQNGDSLDAVITISAPEALSIEVSEDALVYVGYEAAESCADLSVLGVTGGTGGYTYEWSTGATGATLNVCPEETTTYTVTVTDTNGCTITAEVTVEVVDLACGNNPRNPRVQLCYRGREYCLPPSAVPTFLRRGAVLGSCDQGVNNPMVVTGMRIAPNPVANYTTIYLNSAVGTSVAINVYDYTGQLVLQTSHAIAAGSSLVDLDLTGLRRGFYYVKPTVNGVVQKVKVLIKR